MPMKDLTTLKAELARSGFVIENEWYWRITESATSLDAKGAVRDFLAPFARHVKARCEIADLAADDDRHVSFRIGDKPFAITLADAPDRVALNAMVADVNRAFAAANKSLAFALIVPNRFELRGVAIADEELATLNGDPLVLIPSTRRSYSQL